ncbi:hypothetical protein E2C01_078242 [Portunus trituberculatus]|uniref:Uncharacterized protein n=1 Tax=Portunus trituberculatus TaxID=210409 RepID=A0A5B7IGH0_PORTR|nr:hypothetical protein [Portunus trituberculatus]
MQPGNWKTRNVVVTVSVKMVSGSTATHSKISAWQDPWRLNTRGCQGDFKTLSSIGDAGWQMLYEDDYIQSKEV